MAMRLEIERLAGIETRYVVDDGVVKSLVAPGELRHSACPGCGVTPFGIVTHKLEEFAPGEKRAGARCVGCNDPVGWFFVTDDNGTIFGKEEDDAMLKHGRARVYGMEVSRG